MKIDTVGERVVEASGAVDRPRVEAELLVIVPAFNEATRLLKVLGEIRALGLPADILVVDDGSTDTTYDVARAAGVHVARHPFNLGAGATTQTGYKFALERGYGHVVQMDGDGQHDPESLSAVLEPVRAGRADFVIGSRFLSAGSYRSSLERRIGNWLFAKLTSLVIGRRITDPTSGYRAMNRKALALCAADFPHDYPDADVLVSLDRAGLTIEEVPALMRPREGGRSMHRGLRPLYYVFKMSLAIFVALLRGRPPSAYR